MGEAHLQRGREEQPHQGFKEYFALGFFQGALLKDRKKVLVQLGQVQAGRVKFTSANEITAKSGHLQEWQRPGVMQVERAAGRETVPKFT